MRVELRRTARTSASRTSNARPWVASRGRHRTPLVLALLLAVAAAAPARAQGNGYLFGLPEGSVTVRGGFLQARAQSDLYTDLTSQFTLSRRDFSGFNLGADVAASLAPNVDVTLDMGYTRTNAPSHYRDFVDNNNAEIEQATSLLRVPITANAKLYLTPRGRSIGKLAWIPSKVTPWVGGGAGLLYYKLQQTGDFINSATNVVRPDLLTSDGWTTMMQAMAGADVSLTPRLALTGDARYLFVRGANLSPDYYKGYEPLDLSGATFALGLTVRF